jgi:hypothetical protein
MPSLAFKKLFRSKKDRKSGSDNTKNETSETRHISGAKAKIASLTNNFRRHTPLVSTDRDAVPREALR